MCIFNLYLRYFFIAALMLSCQSTKETKDKIPKVVYIIVDGIPFDVIKKLDPPVVRDISKVGGLTEAYVGGGKGSYSESPTISAVGYNSLLTGTWANKHNVWGNGIEAPNYHYHSLFRLVKDNNPNLKTAIFSTWLDNRTKLIGEGLEATDKILVDYKVDGLELDTVNYPHDKDSQYIYRIDEAVSDSAASVISKHGPDLSWVYLEFTDDIGHRFGDSPQFYDAVLKADKQIGKVWHAVKEREENYHEDWLIIVTTDHGRDKETGRDHGGQSDRERSTWIVTNARQRNELSNQKPGIVDIFPSIANHLKLTIDNNVANEIDGVPFIGSLDFANLKAEKNGSKIILSWTSFSSDSKLKTQIVVATTNDFNKGGQDNYQQVGEVSVQKQYFEFERVVASKFYKIVAITPNQRINTWLLEK